MTQSNQTEIQTILKNIGSAQRIAVVLPHQVNIDLLSAAVALSTAITTQASASDGTGKTVMIFSSSSQGMPSLAFLKELPLIHSSINSGSQLAIKILNRNAQPKELRYEKSEDGLTVFITPGEGTFKENDVVVMPPATNFDLVIMLGAQNFEQLGKIYLENTKLFFEVPNINIDINPANEFFGTVNLVQTTASSISEVMMDLIEATPDATKNETISTALLAGIISQTSSFRDPKTTPQVLLKASRLITAGAKQQDIIQHLFKTKPLPLLQLWGRALARLTSLPEKQMLTAVVTKADLEKTNSGIEALPIVVRDIIEMITGYSLVVLLAELPVEASNGVQVLIAGLPFEDLATFAAPLTPPPLSRPQLLSGKYQYISFHLDSTLIEVQDKLNKIIETRNSVV